MFCTGVGVYLKNTDVFKIKPPPKNMLFGNKYDIQKQKP